MFTEYQKRRRKSIARDKEAQRAYNAAYYQAHKGQRKTSTSNEAKKRWTEKTYQTYQVRLRKVEDAELIAMIEAEKSRGIGTTEAIKNLISK